MHATGANRLAQAVIRIIFVMREIFEPSLDKAGRDGLRADVHEPPLVKQIVIEIDAAGFNGVENVLRPGDEQPDDRAFFLCDVRRIHSGFTPRSNTALLPGDETSEPVHLRPCMVEWRDAEEDVVFGSGRGDAARLCRNRRVPCAGAGLLRKAGRARGEVDGCIVVFTERDGRDA